MKEIRQFLAGKDTQPLVQGTLADRLREELHFLRDGMGVTAILETEPEELELEPEIEREVYYVLREGLTNITRHSHAGRAEIHLWQREKALEGTLVDDGIGMNLESNGSASSVGLKSMKERIQKIGGELDIKSSPGQGTNISFVVPLVAR
jgi:signal transduction histidine kinase